MMSLIRGAEAIHLYNDSFTELLRENRILALGRSAFQTFARSCGVFAADTCRFAMSWEASPGRYGS